MMAIHKTIKSDIENRLNVKQAFSLMNMYRGLPVVYKATLVSIGGTAKFMVEPPQSICLSWETHTTILEDANTNAIRAQIVNFDPVSGIVELTNMDYANRGIGYRMMVRVEPGNTIPVELNHEGRTVSGELADVSLTGFGIRAKSLGDPPLKLGDVVQVSVELMDKRIWPSGSVINIGQEEDEYRLAVRFGVEMTIPVAIARYITHRRAEIHREIQAAYDKAIQSANQD